jgi:hypothetical protein
VTIITDTVMAHLRNDWSGSLVTPDPGGVPAGPGCAGSGLTKIKPNPDPASMAKPGAQPALESHGREALALDGSVGEFQIAEATQGTQ